MHFFGQNGFFLNEIAKNAHQKERAGSPDK